MGSLTFRPVVPGIRTLWVIEFEREFSSKQGINFYIPSPFENNCWVNTNQQKNQQALQILNRINDACLEIKHKCVDAQTLKSFDEYIRNAKGVFKNLENLDDLIKNFDDLMKKFPLPPADDKEEKKRNKSPF